MRRISGPRTQEGKRAGLRAEWEGFQSVSDAELDEVIANLEAGIGFPDAPGAPQAGVGEKDQYARYDNQLGKMLGLQEGGLRDQVRGKVDGLGREDDERSDRLSKAAMAIGQQLMGVM